MISFKQFRELDEEGRCWSGYKPVKGKKAYSQGSCVKEDGGAVAAGPTVVTGGVAGIGAGSAKFAEPGVNRKKKNNPVMGSMARRKLPSY